MWKPVQYAMSHEEKKKKKKKKRKGKGDDEEEIVDLVPYCAYAMVCEHDIILADGPCEHQCTNTYEKVIHNYANIGYEVFTHRHGFVSPVQSTEGVRVFAEEVIVEPTPPVAIV
jgi:hypothetical protein